MFGKIKNIFKIKKGYMSENKEDISVDILNRRFANHDFQWIKGENMMNIVHYNKIVQQDDQFFICFSDGTRINYEILEEYMTWFPSPIKEVKPQQQVTQPTTQSQASVSSIKFGDSPNVISEASQSPIYNLLARQKKKPIEIELKIKVPLPSKDLFNVLTSSFDDAETEIIQFIIDSIDIDDIRNTLSKSIRENYYGTSSAKGSAPKEPTKKQKQGNEE